MSSAERVESKGQRLLTAWKCSLKSRFQRCRERQHRRRPTNARRAAARRACHVADRCKVGVSGSARAMPLVARSRLSVRWSRATRVAGESVCCPRSARARDKSERRRLILASSVQPVSRPTKWQRYRVGRYSSSGGARWVACWPPRPARSQRGGTERWEREKERERVCTLHVGHGEPHLRRARWFHHGGNFFPPLLPVSEHSRRRVGGSCHRDRLFQSVRRFILNTHAYQVLILPGSGVPRVHPLVLFAVAIAAIIYYEVREILLLPLSCSRRSVR